MAVTWQDIPGNSAGPMEGDGSRKALFHSTEGSSIAGAVATYRANNSWATRTVDGPRRIVARHLPLDVAARSLRNVAGGEQTNREGTILIQYELVGFADGGLASWSDDDWRWLGAEVVGPDCRATGVPLVSTVVWADYPGSYGVGAAQRLSQAAWDAYSGWLGHQHCPENSHGDPGAIAHGVSLALAAARGIVPIPIPPSEDDDMPPHKVRLVDAEPDTYAYVVGDLVVDRDHLGNPITASSVKNFEAVYESDVALRTQVDMVQSAVRAERNAT